MEGNGNAPQPGLGAAYLALLREEPRARGYLGATLVDEVGVAVSGWASMLLITNLYETQRARAALMLPALACFLLGAAISGPLADWLADSTPARLARWRWKVVLWGRTLETAVLAGLAIVLAASPPTIELVLPYVMVSAFMKTALRSTRIAFSVDLLDHDTRARGEDGLPTTDERERPLYFKKHLSTLTASIALMSSVATLAGLVLGGAVLEAVNGRLWLPFAADVLTNVAFVILIWRRCAPAPFSALGAYARPDAIERPERKAPSALHRFWQSQKEGLHFLAQPARRPLLVLLGGAWLVEVITETYDGRMITKHVLAGSDDSVRYVALGWAVVDLVGAALLPLVFRRIGSLGKIFVATLSLDALCIAAAGAIAGAKAPHAILPFALVLSLDRALTLASTSLTEVAQNTVSNASMRGRIAGSYALLVVLGDMAAEALAVAGEDRWGVPGLLIAAGALQAVVLGALAVSGGRRLWTYGLRAA